MRGETLSRRNEGTAVSAWFARPDYVLGVYPVVGRQFRPRRPNASPCRHHLRRWWRSEGHRQRAATLIDRFGLSLAIFAKHGYAFRK